MERHARLVNGGSDRTTKVTTLPTLLQATTERIYWFEYPVETRFYVKITSIPAGG
jgi:hypothetical protein